MEQVELTGRRRYRTTFFGKLVLQVEETGREYDHRGGGSHSPPRFRWRDARTTDSLIQEAN